MPRKRCPLLDGRFSLPWGHSLTDEVALTSVWFKSVGIEKDRWEEDRYLTSRVWDEVRSRSRDKDFIENLYVTWMENLSQTNKINHDSK